MSKVFITFAAGELYDNLSLILKEGIESVSKYPLIIYKPEDFDIKWEPDSWKPAYVYIFKVLSCLKALESYDDVVWLDNDCLPTKNIDKIWNYKIDNYPLLPRERFDNFEVWPSSKPNYQDLNFLGSAKVSIGVIDNDFNNVYLQACCMYFNKNCVNFFEEVYKHYQEFDNNVYPYGDESIINCLIWRDKLSNNLGNVFLCTHYFSPYIIEAVLNSKSSEEYANIFDINHRLVDNEDTFILSHGWTLARHNRIGLIDNNYENILFLHGSKDPNLHRRYLNCIK